MSNRTNIERTPKRTILLTAVVMAMLTLWVTGETARAQQPAEPLDTPAPTPEVAPAPAPVVPARQTLLIGPNNNVPFSFLDAQGEPTGFDVEVMKAIAEKIGKPIEIKLLPADQIEPAIAANEADGVLGLGHARGRPGDETLEERYELCGPTTDRRYRILIRTDSPWSQPEGQLRVLNTLHGMRVGVLEGDPVKVLLEGERNISMVMAKTPVTAVRQLQARRVAALICDEETMRYTGKRLGVDDLRVVGESFYQVKDYGPAISTQADPALARSIAQAVKDLELDGTLGRIRQEWFGYEINRKTYWREIFSATAILIVIVACIAAIMGYRNALNTAIATQTRKLRAENEVLRKQVHDLQGKEMTAPVVEEGPTIPRRAKAAKAQPFGPVPMELKELIRSAEDTLKECAGEDIEVMYHLLDDAPPVLADGDRVLKMTESLVSNARDAILRQRAENPDVPHRVWISTRMAEPSERPANISDDAGDFVALSIRDAGCGIAQEMVQKIFQPGFTTKPDASGRGLTYVYETIAQHGGWIDVESAPGRGATFSIYLPVATM